jgi:hypothetical protein
MRPWLAMASRLRKTRRKPMTEALFT